MDAIFHQLTTQYGQFLCQLVAFGFFFACIEKQQPFRPLPLIKPEFTTELCYPLLAGVLTVLLYTPLLTFIEHAALAPMLPHHAVEEWIRALPFPFELLLALLLLDLITYVEHRFEHRFLWPFHAVHHAARDLTWLTAARVHPINYFSILLFNLVILYVLGFSGPALGMASGMTSVVALFAHVNLDAEWKKPWCYLFISPRFHHWHHATDREAWDTNFCLFFPFIDLLFGTYYCPIGTKPTAFGIADPVPTRFAGQLWYPFRRLIRRPQPS